MNSFSIHMTWWPPAMSRGRGRPSASRLMAFEALTLAVFATLHLTGTLRIGAGDSDGAGVAETLIGVALASGALALWRSPMRGRRVAQFALGFAILGFLVGLSFTLGSGDAIDLIYHLVMLPILVATAVLVGRGRAHRTM
jgi:peptidoglycan/LPS O-acetylase OafA/YrhL